MLHCEFSYQEAKSERGEACVSEFHTAEDKLCQPMKQEFDEYLSKESDVTAYHIEQAFADGFKVGAQMILEVLEVARMIDFEYIEMDGLLYPNIETGMENTENDLSKYGIMRLHYLREHKREMYREMFLTGELAEHCRAIDKIAFEQSEQIQAAWLETHPMPLEDTLERIILRTQALAIADEIVIAELIYT